MNVLFLIGLLTVILLCLAIAVKPTRKALGVTFCFLGFLESITGIGIIIGVPTIFIGALLLFC